MVNKPKQWSVGGSRTWWKNVKYKVDGDRLKLRGWGVVYKGVSMKGLTDGLLARRFFPKFQFDKATVVSTTRHSRGQPLSTPFVALSKQTTGPASARAGLKRGNNLTRQVAAMVYFHCEHHVPLHVFSVVAKQTRTPVRAGKKLINRYFEPNEPDVDVKKKKLLTLLNSTTPHLPFLVQKLIEMGIEPDGFEVPVVDPSTGCGTRVDLTGVRTSTGKRINIELKTGGDAYIDNHCGMLRAPLERFRSSTQFHWLLQLAYTHAWFHKTYASVDAEPPLLIRISRQGAFHSFLPPAFTLPLPALRSA